jgi:hypothetical protein
LLWQANPTLTAAQIATALEDTALPMTEGAAGAGAGFIQVNAALGAIPVGVPSFSIAPTQIAAGSTATLTWASFGTSSCTASGDWSGVQSTSGSTTVTPAAAGTLSYSLVCTGANGTGPAATVTLTVQSAAGHHGGGGLDGATLALLAMLWLFRRIICPCAPERVQRSA